MRRMLQRIRCAIFGHRWTPAGSCGFIPLTKNMINRYYCYNCGLYTNIKQPGWHLRAEYHARTKCDNRLFTKYPNPYPPIEPDYDDQLLYLNEHYAIDVLADIHETTIEELKKAGYDDEHGWKDNNGQY